MIDVLVYLAFVLFSAGVFRFVVRREYLTRGKLSVWGVTLETLVFAIHANISYLFVPVGWPGWPGLEERPLLNTIGLSLIVIGVVGVIAAMIQLGFRSTMGQGKERFSREGFYRWTRNPQIVLYALVVVGYALLWPSLSSLLWVVAYGIVAQIMVRTEEAYLEKMFGADYLNYCQQVSRYLFISKKIT